MNIDGQRRYLEVSKTYSLSESSLKDLGGEGTVSSIFNQCMYFAGTHIRDGGEIESQRVAMNLTPLFRALYNDAPLVKRRSIPRAGRNEVERELNHNRRYLIGKTSCFDIKHTHTSIPIEFVHLLDNQDMCLTFEDKDGFEFNGYIFNHIYIHQDSDKLRFSAYTDEGFGPIQFVVKLEGLSNNNEIITNESIDDYIFKRFENIEHSIQQNHEGRILLSNESRTEFIESYFGVEFEKLYSENIEKILESLKSKMYEMKLMKSRIEAIAVDIALDEIGWLEHSQNITAVLASVRSYWTHSIGMIIKLLAILHLEPTESPFKLRKTNAPKQKKSKYTEVRPYFRLKKKTDDSSRGNGLGQKLRGRVFVRGFLRRQPVKNLDKYTNAKSRSVYDAKTGENVTRYFIPKYISPFWKGEGEIITPKTGLFGKRGDSVSYAENSMVDFFRMMFGDSFIHDSHHAWAKGPNGEKYRIDGLVNHHDFLLAIEVDGEQHRKYIPHYHRNGEADFEKQKKRDDWIKKKCAENKFELLILPDDKWDCTLSGITPFAKECLSEEMFSKLQIIISEQQQLEA